MEAAGGTATATCPECGATFAVDPHHVRWCDAELRVAWSRLRD